MTITKLIVTAQPGGFDVPSTGNRSIMDLRLQLLLWPSRQRTEHTLTFRQAGRVKTT